MSTQLNGLCKDLIGANRYEQIMEEDRKEREEAFRGRTELQDTDNPHVESIRVIATDNGVVKCVRVGNVPIFEKGAMHVQGTMMQQLADFMYKTFGIIANTKGK